MTDLLAQVLRAHGGVDRYQKMRTVTATIVSDGELFRDKGLAQDLSAREMTVYLHEERASVRPFGAPDQRTDFTADRIAIEKMDGTPVAERKDPRPRYVTHTLSTPWDPLDRAYFNGYALWTYLATPFFMTLDGFTVEETKPWVEGNEEWRCLRVTFPEAIASHCRVQLFYFGSDFLLRRHDYNVDIAGGFAAAQYVYDLTEADGFVVPTKRRAFLRASDGTARRDHLMVSIDVADIRFS
ncbi:hypothetical protein [Streptomyces sp. NPDC090080]|uniref:hypothetical protein n=1 Tax=Streptomyces sp. NPDC090080 TaxID=3365939 RepID=UPI0038096C20